MAGLDFPGESSGVVVTLTTQNHHSARARHGKLCLAFDYRRAKPHALVARNCIEWHANLGLNGVTVTAD